MFRWIAESSSQPLYWLLHSAAAYKALWQLVVRPHYWEKTVHGLTHVDPAFPARPTVGRQPLAG